jgi:hypothetical protein
VSPAADRAVAIRRIGSAALLASLCAAALAGAGGCASGGGRGHGGDGGGGRYTDPIAQITLHDGKPGWGGFQIGMTFHDAQAAAGRRLPSLGLEAPDPTCGFIMVDISPLVRQPLRLEFEPGGDTARLKAIWLLLPDRSGQGSATETVRALKARFPGLSYFVSATGPSLPEANSPRPVYRLPGGAQFLVDPRLGVYFGDLCFS